MRPHASRSFLVALVLGSRIAGATPPPAAHDTQASIEQCSSDSETAQRQRRSGKLRAAREAFRKCAAASCPDAISSFCVGRLSEVEASIPTVVVLAHGADGADVPDLDVWVDGVLTGTSDGRAFEVDPGAHALSTQRGASVISRTSIVVAEGEKLRSVTVTLPPPEPPRPRPEVHPGPGPWFYVAAGVGVASLVTGALFWSSGLRARSHELEPGGCAPDCASSVRESIRDRILVGDGFVLTGALALGLATYLYFRPPQRQDVARR